MESNLDNLSNSFDNGIDSSISSPDILDGIDDVFGTDLADSSLQFDMGVDTLDEYVYTGDDTHIYDSTSTEIGNDDFASVIPDEYAYAGNELQQDQGDYNNDTHAFGSASTHNSVSQIRAANSSHGVVTQQIGNDGSQALVADSTLNTPEISQESDVHSSGIPDLSEPSRLGIKFPELSMAKITQSRPTEMRSDTYIYKPSSSSTQNEIT